jgi:hypothetical protein
MARRKAGDDSRITKLQKRLRDEIAANGRFADPAAALSAVWRAAELVWPSKRQTRPDLVLVLAASWDVARYRDWAMAGFMLFREGGQAPAHGRLIDADDVPIRTISVEVGDERALAVCFNPALTHSQLRWTDPAGDRAIVVLPPEYEGIDEPEA